MIAAGRRKAPMDLDNRARYLDLLKKSLLDELYLENKPA